MKRTLRILLCKRLLFNFGPFANWPIPTILIGMKKLIFAVLVLATGVFGQPRWERFDVGTDAAFRGLSVVNADVVWASGTGGTVVRTIDGGRNWQVLKVPDAEKLDFRDIEAFDANTAYILSIGTGGSSRIYKTIDGGKSWNLQFKNTDEKAFFDAMAFWDKNNGIAMSDPVGGKYVLIRTTDGTNWSAVDTAKMPAAKEGEAAFAASGTCLVAKGAKSLFLISGGSDARVFKSTDRGTNWTVTDSPLAKGAPGSGIFSIALFDALNGVIVGGNYEKPEDRSGTMALTKNGGKTWTAGSGLGGYRSGVAFIDKKNIVAVGTNGSDISSDGGATWAAIDKENYNAVMAKGKAAVWAVGPKGMVARIAMK